MYIEIFNLLDNEKLKIENIRYNKVEKKISYTQLEEEYVFQITNDYLELFKVSDLSYKMIFKNKKLTKTYLKLENYLMKIYILTKKLKIEEKKIELEYNIYSDENINNLISSFVINISFEEE